MPIAPNLLTALAQSVARWPETPIEFPVDSQCICLAELYERSRFVASWLHGCGVRSGTHVGLLCPNSEAFLLLLFAAQHLGAVPVALPLPPGPSEYEAYTSRLQHILSDLGDVVAVAHPRFSDVPLITGSRCRLLHWSEDWKLQPRPGSLPPSRPVEPAFIQYTSGSTSAPKGVALSHANLLAGVGAIARGIALSPRDRASIWLPLFHDMGFVGTLTALLHGTPLSIWTPAAFLRRPERWLAHFATNRCTVSLGPNFSFDYLVDSIPAAACADLDLSAWRIAFNGGEQVEADTLERFSARYGPYGFRESAHFPVYGLAEATLACTFPSLDEPPSWTSFSTVSLQPGRRAEVSVGQEQLTRRLVTVGRGVYGHEVQVINSDGRITNELVVGQIRVRGPAVMSGYYGNHEATRETLRGEWLITGDLGFMYEGRLYVCGRQKEMIVVRGRNYYPFDAETAVRSLAGVHRHRCVAVALYAGARERVGVFIESLDEDASALQALGQQAIDIVQRALDVNAIEVHLVRRGTLKRTSSGKYRRTLLAQEYQAGDLHDQVLASFAL